MNYDYQSPFENDSSMQQMTPPPPANQNGHGFAIASLVLGILALLFTCCCAVNLIAGILAIVFAVVAKVKSGKMPIIAKVGLILAIVAIVLMLLLYGIYLYTVNEAIRNPEGEVGQKLDQFLRQYTGKGLQETIDEAQNSAGAQT